MSWIDRLLGSRGRTARREEEGSGVRGGTATSRPGHGGGADFSNVQSSASVGARGGATEASTGAGRTYTVQAGDSLSKIAEREYGDPQAWRRIYEANRGLINDPDRIFPGQTLTIP